MTIHSWGTHMLNPEYRQAGGRERGIPTRLRPGSLSPLSNDVGYRPLHIVMASQATIRRQNMREGLPLYNARRAQLISYIDEFDTLQVARGTRLP